MKNFKFKHETGETIPLNSEYQLISPEAERLRETEEYLKNVQFRRSSDSSIFIPTGLGVLVTPDRNNKIFSIYGAPQNCVYDLPSLKGEFSMAETTDVKFCGVTTLKTDDGFHLLTHAGGPDAVKVLTARGLEIAQANGADISQLLKILLFFNRQQGYDTYISGDMSYKQKLADMAKRLNLKFDLQERAVTDMTKITA